MTFDEITPLDLLNYFKRYYKDEEFDVNQYGEFSIIKNEEIVSVANFTLIPMELIKRVDKDGTIKPYKYIFTGLIFDGESMSKLPRIEVLYENLSKRKWLSEQYPFCIFRIKETTGFKYILQFILKTQKNISVSLEYDNTGWHKLNDKWVYVHSDGVIGSNTRGSSINTDSSLRVDHKLSPKEAFTESLNMLDICDRKLTHSLLCLTLTSILTTPLMKEGLSPNFSMWIYGKSGLGKTTLSKLFTQTFQSNKIVHVYDYKKDIKKTVLSRDCVSIFDDYGTAKTKQNEYRMDEKVEEIIRWVGDREVTSNYTVRPEGMSLFTGETFLNLNSKNASSIARVIRVEMDNLFNKKEKNYDLRKVNKFDHFQSKPYLSTSIWHYLNWLSEKLNSHFLENYRQDFLKLKKEIKEIAHERQIDSIVHLIVSYNFYLSYGREKEFITPEQFSDYSSTAKDILLELLEEQNIPAIDQSVELFMSTLEKLVIDGKISVSVKGIPYPPLTSPHGILDLEEQTLSMTWQPVYEMAINEILATNDEIIDFISDKKLGKLLRGYKLIYRQENDRNTKPVTGLEGRAIQFNTSKLTKQFLDTIIEINKNSSFNLLLAKYAENDQPNTDYKSLSKKERNRIKGEIRRISNNFI